MGLTPLARFLRDQLARNDETVEQFALRAGLNASGLYKIMRGEYTDPRETTLKKIAAGFGLSMADLGQVLDQPENASSALDPRLAAFLKHVEDGWLSMDEAARDLAERGTRALFSLGPAGATPHPTTRATRATLRTSTRSGKGGNRPQPASQRDYQLAGAAA